MAGSDYVRGEMDVSEQTRTWEGFMTFTLWGSGLILLIIGYATFTLALGMNWVVALGLCLLLGIGGGMLVGMGGAWFATVLGAGRGCNSASDHHHAIRSAWIIRPLGFKGLTGLIGAYTCRKWLWSDPHLTSQERSHRRTDGKSRTCQL